MPVPYCPSAADKQIASPDVESKCVPSKKCLHFLWLLGGSWAVGDCQVGPWLRTVLGNAASGVTAAAVGTFGLFIPIAQFPGDVR